MRILSLFLLVFGAALVQSLLIPFNWLLFLVLFWALSWEPQKSLVWAFVAGLVADLVFGQRLGASSLVFLGFSQFIFWAEEKLANLQLPLIFLGGFLAEIIYDYLLFQNWFWGRALLFGLALALISTRVKKQTKGLKLS